MKCPLLLLPINWVVNMKYIDYTCIILSFRTPIITTICLHTMNINNELDPCEWPTFCHALSILHGLAKCHLYSNTTKFIIHNFFLTHSQPVISQIKTLLQLHNLFVEPDPHTYKCMSGPKIIQTLQYILSNIWYVAQCQYKTSYSHFQLSDSILTNLYFKTIISNSIKQQRNHWISIFWG